MKRIIPVILLICALTFAIYNYTERGIRLVSIGDSLAKGLGPYGITGLGYSDFVKKHLEENNKLRSYNKSFAIANYRSTDLIRDITNNKAKKIDGNTVKIQNIIHESDVLLISIGANDIFYKLGVKEKQVELLSDDRILEYIDQTIDDLNHLYELISKYARNQVIVIGYYNPLTKYSIPNIDEKIKYANNELKKLCIIHNFTFIDTYHIFKNNPDFLPNPRDVHPSKLGYQAIAKLIIAEIERNIKR